MRRQRNESWQALGGAADVNISWRTLQAIALRAPLESEIKKNTKIKLEKVAAHWGISYSDLFVEIEEQEPVINALDELEDFEEIIAKQESFIAETGAEAPEIFKEFAIVSKGTKFLYRDSFDTLLNEYLMASPKEYNHLGEAPIAYFIGKCNEYGREDSINEITKKLIDKSDQIKIKVLQFFAIAMFKSKFKDKAIEIMEVATDKVTNLINQ